MVNISNGIIQINEIITGLKTRLSDTQLQKVAQSISEGFIIQNDFTGHRKLLESCQGRGGSKGVRLENLRENLLENLEKNLEELKEIIKKEN